MKRCVALAIAAFRKPSILIAPPIMLNIPKSMAPNALSITRVVYSEINMVIPI